ncbi:technical knockout [Leptinotarsa decemlineata]|uniref:technical knockout n=1 Tax=Leptinotarsa decemlineata TaxID=7539 RepID=UPI003D308BFB
MAEIIIPGELLEKLTCHSCLKFLSVGPVKLYKGQVKCGRCSRDDDGGVISMYEFIAEQCLFKCVNRFDGCKQLIQYCKVIEHEAECKPEIYKCPYCPDTEMPTFLLPKHFVEHHDNFLMNTAYICADIIWVGTLTYLYYMKDHMFYIEIKYPNGDMLLNAYQLRKYSKSSAIKVFFTVIGNNGNTIPQLRGTVVNILSRPSRGYRIHKSRIDTVLELNINVNMNFENCGEVILLNNSEVSRPSSRSTSSVDMATNTVDIVQEVDPLLIFMSPTPMYSDKLMNWPRKLKMQVKPVRKNRNRVETEEARTDQNFAMNLDFTGFTLSTETDNWEIFPNCINCAEMYLYYSVTNGVSDGSFLQKAHRYYAVCFFCQQYYKMISAKALVHVKELDKVAYIPYCMWGCNNPPEKKLIDHEITCVYQPSRSCPVEGCGFQGWIFHIFKHFRQHQQALFSCYTTFSLVLNQECQEYYIYVPPHFAVLTWQLIDQTFELSLSLCNRNHQTQIEPQALIFSSDQEIKFDTGTSRFLLKERSMASLYQMHKTGPHVKTRPARQALDGNPFMKGVVLKTLIKKPKKPNSANRKCVLVRLSNGKEMVAYVPGIGHNLQEHNIVLCRVGRVQDCPGVKIKCVRGKFDLGHVVVNKK